MIVRAVLYTLIPLAATVAGAAVATSRPPSPRVTSAVQHLAAGVVFAAVALELIPPVRERNAGVAVIGFSLGIVVMWGLRRLTDRLESSVAAIEPANPPVRRLAGASAGLLLAIAVDVFVNGAVLGAGFAAASRTGLLLTVALTLELLFLGLSGAAALLGEGARAARVILTSAAIGALLTLGTAIGVLLLDGASANVLDTVLAFGAVALMYLVTEELLSEAHEVPDTAWATALFFVGFLVYLLVSELLG